MPRKTDTERLADEALALLDDAIHKGQFTLSTGKSLTLEADQIIRVAQWAVQNLKARKPKPIADTSELGIAATRRQSHETK